MICMSLQRAMLLVFLALLINSCAFADLSQDETQDLIRKLSLDRKIQHGMTARFAQDSVFEIVLSLHSRDDFATDSRIKDEILADPEVEEIHHLSSLPGMMIIRVLSRKAMIRILENPNVLWIVDEDSMDEEYKIKLMTR